MKTTDFKETAEGLLNTYSEVLCGDDIVDMKLSFISCIARMSNIEKIDIITPDTIKILSCDIGDVTDINKIVNILKLISEIEGNSVQDIPCRPDSYDMLEEEYNKEFAKYVKCNSLLVNEPGLMDEDSFSEWISHFLNSISIDNLKKYSNEVIGYGFMTIISSCISSFEDISLSDFSIERLKSCKDDAMRYVKLLHDIPYDNDDEYSKEELLDIIESHNSKIEAESMMLGNDSEANGISCEFTYIDFSKDYSDKMTRKFSMPEFNMDFMYVLSDVGSTDLLVTIYDHELKVYEFALWQGGWKDGEVSVYDNGEIDITKAKGYITKIMNTIPE